MLFDDSKTWRSGRHPIFQALATLSGVVLVNVVALLVRWLGIVEVGDRFPWMVAASFMLLFAVFNSVLALSASSMNRYYTYSVYSFAGVALLSGLLAWGLSSLSISEAGSYRWIFIVVSIGYMIFLGLMSFLRTIVEFAQREEWNHPRMRNKPKGRSRP